MKISKIRVYLVAMLLITVSCRCGAEELCHRNSAEVVVLGDSNTWLGGDSCNRDRGWTRWFCEAFRPASCRSYARSGATWTTTPKTVRDVGGYTEKLDHNNVIFNQICRLADDVSAGRQARPTLVIISAGTNDVWFKSARPGALDATAAEILSDGCPAVDGTGCGKTAGTESDMSSGNDNKDISCIREDTHCARNGIPAVMMTLAGAVSRCCGILKESYPGVRIVLLTPMQSTAVSVSDISRAGDIIEDCGRRMGLMVIRQDRDSCVKRAREQRRRCMTTDGTHTSVEGARRNGMMIARRLAAPDNLHPAEFQ